MSKKIAILGAGGHGKVIGEIALLNKYENIEFFDDKSTSIKEFPFPIIGNLEYLKNNFTNYEAFFVGIGDNQIRFNLIQWLKSRKLNIVSLVHPSSTLSRYSSVGIGSCIMPNAVINAGTLIKEGVIINTSASIDHDCVIENYVHISPNCAISGQVIVEEFTQLGTSTSVHPRIKIETMLKQELVQKYLKCF